MQGPVFSKSVHYLRWWRRECVHRKDTAEIGQRRAPSDLDEL